jgi:hypothetical protein
MADSPKGSETILPEPTVAISSPEPPPEDPVSAFKKTKAKRESKRKEVKVITEYVPEPPAPTTPLSEAVEVPAPPVPDVESIAGRVAEMLFAKMGREKADLDKTPEKVKTGPKRKPPPKKAESPPPPPTKYFGWC